MRRVALAILLVAFPLSVVGCGATPELEGVASAAEKVEQSKTFRFAFTWDDAGFGAGEGAIDLANERLSISMRPDDSAGGASTGPTELVFVDGKLYMKNPEFPAVGGKHWVAMEGPAGAIDYPDPSSALDVLRPGAEFDRIGQDEVRGVETTRYRGTVGDGAKGIAAAGSVVEAWIDGEGYVRKLTFEDGATTATVEFYDFGGDVSIEAPPTDEVATIEELGEEGDAVGVEPDLPEEGDR